MQEADKNYNNVICVLKLHLQAPTKTQINIDANKDRRST